jgi:SAM-dependent methyltransferase
MDLTEQIARCMALYAHAPDIQRVQTLARQLIAAEWGIPAGARVLEIGCGQGDLTAVLADAVGPEGHVTACDPAGPGYGAPIPLGESTDFLSRSALGDRITFRLGCDLLATEIHFDPDSFDFAVLGHSSWYFPSLAVLRETFERVRPWARRLCLAEWDLAPRSADQLAHALAVQIQGRRAAFDPSTEANIRTPYLKETALTLFEPAGWRVKHVGQVDTSFLQDGEWEISEGLAVADPVSRASIPPAWIEQVRLEAGLLRAVAESFGRRSLASFTVVAEWAE